MSKNSSLLLFGGLIVLVSFLGIPSSWKTIIFSVLGVLVITSALLLRKDITSGALCLHLTEEKQTNSYKQNGVLRDKDSEVSGKVKKDTELQEHEKSTTESKT